MDLITRQQLRDHLTEALDKHGDRRAFGDDESLFLSGRLDSFAMMNLVIFLESSYGLDFSDFDFDIALLDSLDAIAHLVDQKQGN